MIPSRRRLNDLKQLILQAENTYFEPNLFRLNINNAIQTARTVTFLIQKQKAAIPDFERWYETTVVSPFKSDPKMEWLKESRNRIEKEGDLDLYSEGVAQCVFSYTEEGRKISLKDERMLFLGIAEIMRHMRAVFPPGIYRDSAISVERRWVATTFPTMELTELIRHGHAKLLGVVASLEAHLGISVAAEHETLYRANALFSRRHYLKIANGEFYQMKNESLSLREMTFDMSDRKPELEAIANALKTARDIPFTVERLARIACDLYNKDKYHVTIGFVLNDNGEPLQLVSPQFGDQIDKIIFWRDLGRAAQLDQRISAIIFLSEIWIRSLEGFPNRRLSDLEILGEALQIVGADASGVYAGKTIEFVKTETGFFADITRAADLPDRYPNFLFPLKSAWEARLATNAEVNKGSS